MNVGIIAIDNGLGHMRRQIIIANYLSKFGCNVELLCNTEYVNKFDVSRKINLVHFKIKVVDLINNDLVYQKLSKIEYDKYDIFISDNIIEVLEFKPDAYIFANFFWHRSLNISKNYYKKSEKILNDYKPNIIANKYFAPLYVSQMKNTKLVGMFSNFKQEDNKLNLKKDILISKGFGAADDRYFDNLSLEVSHFANQWDCKVWVEPMLLKYFQGHRYCSANYSSEMYASIKIALVRPGMGTISDLLACGSKIFSFYEKSNNEMVHNAHVLSNFGHFDYAYDNLSKSLNKLYESSLETQEVNGFSFDGPKDTKRIIFNLI
jgi:hypothetical protein